MMLRLKQEGRGEGGRERERGRGKRGGRKMDGRWKRGGKRGGVRVMNLIQPGSMNSPEEETVVMMIVTEGA